MENLKAVPPVDLKLRSKSSGLDPDGGLEMAEEIERSWNPTKIAY